MLIRNGVLNAVSLRRKQEKSLGVIVEFLILPFISIWPLSLGCLIASSSELMNEFLEMISVLPNLISSGKDKMDVFRLSNLKPHFFSSKLRFSTSMSMVSLAILLILVTRLILSNRISFTLNCCS